MKTAAVLVSDLDGLRRWLDNLSMRLWWRSSAGMVAVGLLLLPSPAWGQESAVPQHTMVTNGAVHAIAPAGDKVYIGGEFTRVGSRTGPGAAISRETGLLRRNSSEVEGGGVAAAVADGSGGWYVGGWFTSVGGIPRNGLAHLFADGRVDARFRPALGDISRLALAGRTLYAADDGNQLAALDASTGKLRWRVHTKSGGLSALAPVGSARCPNDERGLMDRHRLVEPSAPESNCARQRERSVCLDC
jgi:outer membrane protein assembly factor BamB